MVQGFSMRHTTCLRPAACLRPAVQPITCRSLLAQPATKAPRAALARRPSLAGQLSGLRVPLPGSLTRRVIVTRISASSDCRPRVFSRRTTAAGAQLTPAAKEGFCIPWRSIFRVLVLVPVFLIPAFLPRQSAYAKPEPQARRTLEVWPANHYREEAPTVSTSNSNSHSSTYRGGFEGDIPHGFDGDLPQHHTSAQHHTSTQHHSPPQHTSPQHASGFEGDMPQHHTSPAGQTPHSVSDSSTARVAVFVTCGVALLFWLRMAQRKEGAVNARSEVGWKEPYEPQDISPDSQPATPAAAVTAAGRPLSVQERQEKAQQDIAAAKAREAAFAGQGTRQFTDTNIAQPVAPDFGLEDFSGGSATDTFELRDSGAQSEDENPTGTFVLSPDGSDISSGGRQQSEYDSDASQPPYGGSRADLEPGADREQDAKAELQGQSRQPFTPGQSAAASRAANDTPTSLPVPGTSRPSYAATIGDTNADTAAEPADMDRPAPVYEADTSEPSYTQGRSDQKPQADDEQDAREKAQAELQKPSKQASSLRQPAARTAGDTEADTAGKGATTAAEGDTRAKSPFELQMQPQQTASLTQPGDTAAEGDMSAEPVDTDRPAPVYKADTSKPAYTQGRADLKPRADDEHDAREKAQAELQQQSKQKFTPDASGYEAVRTVQTEGKPRSASPAAASTAAPTSAASEQPGPVSKPMAGGRAPTGEHEAREKAMAELQKKSQEQQPVTSMSPGTAEAIKPQAPVQKQKQPLASEEQPLSERNQTQDLAKGLAGASMSAEPTEAKAQGRVLPSAERQRSPFQAQQAARSTFPTDSAGERQPSPFQAQQAASSMTNTDLAGERQPSPLQAQQAASSMPTADSAAASLSPASQPQNPFQNLVSAFQGLLGGQASSSPSSSFARNQAATGPASPSGLSTAQQAQLTPADASAAQRMAASSQSLAAGKGQAGVTAGVPVKRYTEVTPEGDVEEFVRERGLRAPLLLLAGIAASAAQTLEPLWPVQLDSRGRKRPAPSDEEPLDWQRYQKYDVFNDLLTAAAASPAAQGEQNSPFRALVNMVPQQGVPKYDFLRKMLRGSLDSPDSAPEGPRGPDGRAQRSKYDPFHSLLQSAQADPTWPSVAPALDPLAAALQDGKLPWKPITSKYDPFQAIFNAEDPTGSSPAPLDPLSSLAEQARQPQGAPRRAAWRSKLDPFEDLFNAEGPSSETSTLDPVGNLLQNARQPKALSVESKYDPFQAIFNAEGPSSDASTLDPLGNLLQNVRQPNSPSVQSKYDPFQAIFNAEGPSSEASTLDPLGNLLQSVGQPNSPSVQSKYDPFQALFNAEGPSSEASDLDPLGNLLQNVRQSARQPQSASVKSKYDPFHSLLQSAQADHTWPTEAPALDPLAAALQDGKLPWKPITSKYDPFQAIFNAEDPTGSSPAPLDPLSSLAEQARQPRGPRRRAAWRSKLDPFEDLFDAQGPSSETSKLDPLGNLLQTVRQNVGQPKSPSVQSKYDPFQAIFKAEGPGDEQSPLDPLGNLLEGARQPSIDSKYDPFQAMFNAEGPSSDPSPLDPLGNLLESARQPEWQSVNSKYDPFQGMFTAEGPGADTAALDPLGNLLQAVRLPRQASVDSKYDPFQAIFRAQGPSAGAAALDPLGALLEDGRQPWRPIKSKYDPFQAIFNARGATGEAELDPLPHVIRGIKARAQLALHRRGSGAVPSKLDKYDLVQQVLSSEAPAGPTPGFDPVGSLLKSSWVKERQAKRQQARWRPAALETAQGQAPRGSTKAGPGRAPAGQHQARERAMAAQQARAKQPRAAGQQPQAGESEGRQQAVADLQRRAKQPGAVLDTQAEGDLEGEDRPSEWSGFIYNPYSGDLLPPEDGDNEDEQDASQPGSTDATYGTRRSGGGGGSGKPQFISANPSFRGPSSIKRPTQVQALGATAVAMAALSPEATEAAPAAALPKAKYDVLTMLMHLGCM